MADEIYCDEKYVTIWWNPDIQSVHVEWRAWANTDEIRAALEKGLKALRDHHATRWLADCLRRRVVQEDAQEWLDQSWLPQARALGLRRMAVVLPVSEVSKGTVEDLVAKYSATEVETRKFATVEEARSWLAEDAP
jgi:hypothetical protein